MCPGRAQTAPAGGLVQLEGRASSVGPITRVLPPENGRVESAPASLPPPPSLAVFIALPRALRAQLPAVPESHPPHPPTGLAPSQPNPSFPALPSSVSSSASCRIEATQKENCPPRSGRIASTARRCCRAASASCSISSRLGTSEASVADEAQGGVDGGVLIRAPAAPTLSAPPSALASTNTPALVSASPSTPAASPPDASAAVCAVPSTGGTGAPAGGEATGRL